MANWLDKYEQGGLVLKQKTKDNYGKQSNYNDAKVSTPPGYVGMGYDTKGRNYSPAWGGQFQNGGVMNKASMFASLPTPTDIYNYGRRESEEIAKRAKLMWESKSLNPTLPMHSDTLYPGNKYKDAFMKTPNIRTKNDKSFKKGHPLTNEQKAIVLHHTGYTDTARDNDVSWAMRGVDAQFRKPGESSHVVIDFNGNRYNYANPNQVTYHAGNSMMNDRDNVNDFGVGVEFQGDTDQRPLTKEQIESFMEYAAPIMKKNKIPIDKVVTHKQIRKNYIDKNPNDKDVQSKPDVNDKEYSKIIQALKKKGVLQMGGSIPGAVGFTYVRTQDPAPSNGPYAKKTKASAQNGSVIKDDRGQLAYPGEITEIGSNDITMQGVDYPVLGVSDTGDTKMMQPDQDYKFDGEKVIEYPIMQEGGWLDKFQDGGDINKKLKKEAEETIARRNANRTTMSQYTPKKGEQEKWNKEKLQRIAEDNAPLNRMAASKGAANMQDAMEFAALVEGGMAAGKFAGKYLTEETALKNAYKLNPYAFKADPTKYYRQAGKAAYDDAMIEGKMYAKGQKELLEKNPNINYTDEYNASIAAHEAGKFHLTKPANAPFVQKGKLFYPIDRKPTGAGYKGTKFADAEYLFEGALPDDAVLPRYQEKYLSSLNESKGAGVVRPEFNDLDNFKTYQKNWLKGYKEVSKKEDGGWLNKYK